MNQIVTDVLRQRADYTHKYNTRSGRHGWLRLTPAYSLRIVNEIIGTADGNLNVLDPFCGTATTALCAAYHGQNAMTTDINPFLVWFGGAKTAHYSKDVVKKARTAGAKISSVVMEGKSKPIAPPPIHNIDRWWSKGALSYLCRLQTAIDSETKPGSAEATLLRIAFCRTLIECSNASFNHQSMSFKDSTQAEMDFQPEFGAMFINNVNFVLEGALENPEGSAEVVLHDARDLASIKSGPFNLVVTSPPYANRMSYIRELRPYMYWLGFLTSGRDAGELDWQAIGGTWGIATSRLTDWKPNESDYSSLELDGCLTKISSPDNANGELLSKYVRKYCVDMAKHFTSLTAVLAKNARVHYIVGNSTFYGELISVERIYAHMMESSGFCEIEITPIRKRNSKKELIEFDVSASFPG